MRMWSAIVALLLLGAATAQAQTPNWHLDGGIAALVEAWDENEARESLAGVVAGIDRRVWKALAVRTEGVVLRVSQTGGDAWLRGFTIGVRNRWQPRRVAPFVELAAGLSDSTRPVPPNGTAFNFLIVSGGGVEIALGRASLDLGARWLHVSNNGREGNRNPDIQTLGLMIGIGLIH
jgi:hypothetical protein